VDVEHDLCIKVQKQVKQVGHAGADQAQAGRGKKEDDRKGITSVNQPELSVMMVAEREKESD
jgi:hypothetical protein